MEREENGDKEVEEKRKMRWRVKEEKHDKKQR